ncbi:uncharacterized protein LY89DRAFT_705116 [Mollisia scopiformis]|uniref:Protein HRI1 n=1 Tax=Mollisia scopiformis TaxID=149040 RepID=A0A194XM03_MOLSC|nr:uncharacterized protein LY89DRAFT_705116 [Mollisia scopiformis]KUJ21275.1 hypothetical protein LY89DRAFT_705116 [Mollisia scopiformis]
MAPKISARISLRWLPSTEAPSEPTDTIVFGVGAYFVDLRVLKTDNTIDWALAGERQIVSTDPLKVRWIKTLDSLGLTEEPDEGDFTTLPNGDSLETGAMPCPEKGMAVTQYEEVWQVLAPQSGPDGEKGSAWILESIDAADTMKTFLGRIGGSYMAMRGKTGEAWKEGEFGARSEEWDASDRKWKNKHVIGYIAGLPSPAELGTGLFAGEDTWKEGDKVAVLGQEYIVRAFEALQ